MCVCAAWGNINTVRKLLEFGADKTTLNHKRATPLQAAFEAGRLNISEELDRWDQFSATEVERDQRQAEIDAARAQSAIDAEGEEDDIYLQLQALAMKEKELGADHIGLRLTLEKLARIYRKQVPPRYADSEAVLRRLLLVTRKEFGSNHMETAKVLNNVGEVVQASGRPEECVELLEQALNAVLKSQGAAHQDSINSMENLALVHHIGGNFDKAEPLLLRMLEAQEKVLGNKHVGIVKTLDLLGTQCLKQVRVCAGVMCIFMCKCNFCLGFVSSSRSRPLNPPFLTCKYLIGVTETIRRG